MVEHLKSAQQAISMRENQENMVKITNLDLGESTMEHEDKTLSNYGRAR